MVEDQGEQQRGSDQKFDPECVVVAVVGRLELDVHQVDGGAGRADEEKLHGGVVERDEGGEEVKVSRAEDRQEEDLGLARYSSTAARLPDLGDNNAFSIMISIKIQTFNSRRMMARR